MYLATTTGDFGGYTPLQTKSMEYIRQSGFSYLDYNFGSDYARRDGVYSENWKDYLQTIREKAEELSIIFQKILHRICWFKGISQCPAQAIFGSGNGAGNCGTGQAKFTCNIFLRHALEQVQYADLILGACQRFCHA